MSILDRNVVLSLSKEDVVGHYALVAPLMERNFGGVPIVWAAQNSQPNQPPLYHEKYFGHYTHLTATKRQKSSL